MWYQCQFHVIGIIMLVVIIAGQFRRSNKIIYAIVRFRISKCKMRKNYVIYIYIYIPGFYLIEFNILMKCTFRSLLGMLQGEFVVCNHVSEIGLRQSFLKVLLPKTNFLLHVLDLARRNQRSYLWNLFFKIC